MFSSDFYSTKMMHNNNINNNDNDNDNNDNNNDVSNTKNPLTAFIGFKRVNCS